ncbi:hypothetical protein BDY21DRAFT_369724 [Lineolata rhizophorae]|uniref:Uncharacterized protein n=1 Tax=Lineolata rhizophorae TaxID=578093 RepID=A0A6A6P714_9PEZI|nr:hypothetical protein BDY21DRAFT_369724 [Lineolata rhizophorae]
MRDGFLFVVRDPYPATQPKDLVVASDNGFFWSHGTEYVFVELVGGTNLGDIWFDMPEKARITIITKLVELESRPFALRYPASGSLYYVKDV